MKQWTDYPFEIKPLSTEDGDGFFNFLFRFC